MKQNKWNLAAGAIALLLVAALTACSNEETSTLTPEIPEVMNPEEMTEVKFEVIAPEATTPQTRATWNYEEQYTPMQKLGFLWENSDSHINVYHFRYAYQQWMPNIYCSDLTRDLFDPRVFISTKLGSWNPVFDGMMAVFPYDAMRFPFYLDEDPTRMNLKFEIDSRLTQTGRNTDHLRKHMYMFGSIVGSEATQNVPMELKHISALLRFFVVNKGSTERFISKIEMNGKVNLEGRLPLALPAEFPSLAVIPRGIPSNNITIQVSNSSTTRWDRLAPVGQPGSRVAFHAACIATPTAGETYTFSVTTEDENGSNQRTYVSNILNGDRILNQRFEDGTYYTFELLLDDQLTVSSPTISIIPPISWGDESDEIQIY